ncbi:hypothetical protein FA95DRAFT_1538429 [Auriscalpium vulgare]|uniref:Uncharacterized protein n=1 Tax=Auriscalpium vulgare TaxID=40419 RepID=A0ACB8S031_9AGAM|nr:hypothetical protein FA95DRAFT_1538429 [Auriscalpium vulgare]
MLDCEGREIGTADGALSLLSLGSPPVDSQSVFVIDVPAIRAFPPAMQAIAFLLRNPLIVKVVWDGRMDAIELSDVFGVGLGPVLDLQIVEVLSRETRFGETDRDRVQRLARGQFGYRALKEEPELFNGMHVVLGMQRCLEHFRLDFGLAKDTEVVEMHRNHESSRWMDRPLSPKLIQYAANDILLIAHLFAFFVHNDFIPNNVHAFSDVLEKCARYVTRCGRIGRVDESDPFRPKAILLLDSLAVDASPMALCAGCGLVLPFPCFEVFGWSRTAHCRLCKVRAMKTKLALCEYVVPILG